MTLWPSCVQRVHPENSQSSGGGHQAAGIGCWSQSGETSPGCPVVRVHHHQTCRCCQTRSCQFGFGRSRDSGMDSRPIRRRGCKMWIYSSTLLTLYPLHVCIYGEVMGNFLMRYFYTKKRRRLESVNSFKLSSCTDCKHLTMDKYLLFRVHITIFYSLVIKYSNCYLTMSLFVAFYSLDSRENHVCQSVVGNWC